MLMRVRIAAHLSTSQRSCRRIRRIIASLLLYAAGLQQLHDNTVWNIVWKYGDAISQRMCIIEQE